MSETSGGVQELISASETRDLENLRKTAIFYTLRIQDDSRMEARMDLQNIFWSERTSLGLEKVPRVAHANF